MDSHRHRTIGGNRTTANRKNQKMGVNSVNCHYEVFENRGREMNKESWFEFSCIDNKTANDFFGALLDVAIAICDFLKIGVSK